MGRDRRPKHKLSRREGRDLFGTGGSSLERRLNQPPGMHGRRPSQKDSVYAEQLREKQKVKRMYGLREDQFRRLVNTALQSRGQTGLVLLKLLERRLDNIIYRLGLALFDLDKPDICLLRGDEFIFAPEEPYELLGDVDKVVFPCGHTVLPDGDTVHLYYGAADTSIAMATGSV